MELANCQCTTISAYLLIGEVKCVYSYVDNPKCQKLSISSKPDTIY